MKTVWELKQRKMKGDESGYVMVMSLFVIIICCLIGFALAVVGLNEFNLSARARLMDQAYAVAEAGVNRACVQLSTDRRLGESVTYPGGTNHEYNRAGSTPQWPVAGSADDLDGDTCHEGAFGDGTYRVQLWQSEVDTAPAPPNTNPSYKVIKSTGTVTRGNKSVERTIEARIVTGNSSVDYDASFDYLIYNGMNDETPGTNGSTWPSKADDSLQTFWLGKWNYDGATPSGGHAPKGAVYTRGSIDIPARLLSNVSISGNIVAHDNITLHNGWNLGGITLNGNAIAGLAPSGAGRGWAKITTTGTTGFGPLAVSGYVCSPLDVEVTGTISIGQPLTLGGIIAGGNVNVSGTAAVFGQLGLGNVFCAKKTTLKSIASGGISFNTLNTGRDTAGFGADLSSSVSGSITGASLYSQGRVNATTSIAFPINITDAYVGTDRFTDVGGVGFNGNAVLSGISIGSLTSRGRVNATAGSFAPSFGSIYAGTDSATGVGGTGIQASMGGLAFSAGTLKARGAINSTAGGLGGSWSWVWSGSDVNVTFTGLGASIGAVSAGGNLTLNLTLIVGGAGVGRLSANGNATLNAIGVGATYVDGVKAGGNASLSFGGVGYIVVDHFNTSGWGAGPGTPDAAWSGQPGNKTHGVNAGGNIGLYPSVGWLTILGDTYNVLAFCDCGDANAGGSVKSSGVIFSDDHRSGVGGLQGWNPGVDDPGLPAMPNYSGGVPTGTGGLSTAAWLRKTPPMNLPSDPSNTGLMLTMAGLTGPVNILEPNWSHFHQLALDDDRCNPDAYHVISDGGPGDGDGAVNGEIQFSWNNLKKYSSNETVWVDIPDLNNPPRLNITCDWKDPSMPQDFKGTIVTRGPIFITDNPGVTWGVTGTQTLNLVAGGDITVTSGGASLTSSNTANLHFWSHHDIIINNRRFVLVGNNTFYGSFTAGNKVIYSSDNLYEVTNFKWSRWALDPVAWVEPFEVLTWKEI